MIGICSMFGKNDSPGTFTIQDQHGLIDYANENNISLLSGWSTDRDMLGQNTTGTPQVAGEFSKMLADFTEAES